MSDLDSAEKKLHETLAKLSHEVDKLSDKVKEISILENKNNELVQKNPIYLFHSFQNLSQLKNFLFHHCLLICNDQILSQIYQ